MRDKKLGQLDERQGTRDDRMRDKKLEMIGWMTRMLDDRQETRDDGWERRDDRKEICDKKQGLARSDRGGTREMRQETREKDKTNDRRDQWSSEGQARDKEKKLKKNRKITAFLENASVKHFIFSGKKISTTFYFHLEIFSWKMQTTKCAFLKRYEKLYIVKENFRFFFIGKISPWCGPMLTRLYWCKNVSKRQRSSHVKLL